MTRFNLSAKATAQRWNRSVMLFSRTSSLNPLKLDINPRRKLINRQVGYQTNRYSVKLEKKNLFCFFYSMQSII